MKKTFYFKTSENCLISLCISIATWNFVKEMHFVFCCLESKKNKINSQNIEINNYSSFYDFSIFKVLLKYK